MDEEREIDLIEVFKASLKEIKHNIKNINIVFVAVF